MKPPGRRCRRCRVWSPSPRKAWIETPVIRDWTAPSPSPSPRKAWIETSTSAPATGQTARSPSPRKAWIETPYRSGQGAPARRSPSPRKAWIETPSDPPTPSGRGCRLPPGRRGLKPKRVPLPPRPDRSPSPRKAWIETEPVGAGPTVPGSPSPRKAWIETSILSRNAASSASPSPRKAWIETSGVVTRYPPRAGRLPPGRRGLKLRLLI